MGTVVVIVLLLVALGAAVLWSRKQAAARQQTDLDDAKSEARRWVERLGGQVVNLDGATDPAAKQALADASERYTAAGSQLDQARTAAQCRLATQTAMEGLYYVRAARTAMGLDPGPELPDLSGQQNAGKVSEDRRVNVEGHEYAASARPSADTPHYYPGGMVAGRPVPQGWYSEPWWKTALVAGAWGVGSFLLFDAMFSGMHGMGGAGGWGGGDWAGGGDFGGGGGDFGGGGGDFGGGYAGGDWGGGGGGDWGGGGGGDWGGGGGDWGGGGDF